MPMAFLRKSALSTAALTFAGLAFVSSAFCPRAEAQTGTSPFFAPGNLVVVVEGCGVHGGTCTSVKNGTGTGAGNSSAGGYGDNQAAPLTLFQYQPNSGNPTGVVPTYVNSLVLPQTASGGNLPISGEYGSSSEGTLQLSGTGQYLTFMGYGIDAPTFDAAYPPGFTADPYGAAPSGALAQSGSLTTGVSYTPIARVITLVDPYGNVNSSTPLYNVFNTNNPRSIYTADGVTSAYVSGQGSGCDATGGVFYVNKLGAPNTAPTAITGIDTGVSSSCNIAGSQDTRIVQIHNNTLYISVDSTEGKSFNRSFIGTLGTPPATSLYNPPANNIPYATGPTEVTGIGNTGGTGKISITTGATSNGNGLNAGLQINISPVAYYFASPSVLYVTDSGNGKQSSATSLIGDGGLQKWINSAPDGSGTWSLAYTLAAGLHLVMNPSATPANTTGTTGLYGLAGTVSNGVAYLYVTNYVISDLDPTYLYGIADTLTTTTNPGTSFTQLDAAPADSNFKGVSFAPTLPAGSATLTTFPSGLTITTAGTGCAPGTYVTPVTLAWTPGSACTLTTTATQMNGTTPELFSEWNDHTKATTDAVVAPSTSAIYMANFVTPGPTSVSVTSPSIAAGTASTTLSTTIGFSGSTPPPASLVNFQVNGSSTGVGVTTCTGTTSPEACTATFASASLAAGSYPIRVTAGSPYSTNGIGFLAVGTGTLTVTATDFTFATGSNSATATLAPGGTASLAFSLGASQGSYPGSVSFAVTGLPSFVTGTFSPSTVSATSGTQTVTLTLTESSTASLSRDRSQIAYGGIAFLAALLLPLCFRRKLSSNVLRSLTVVLFLAGSFAAITGLSGCSNGGSSSSTTTTPGSITNTYPLTVTATSGSVVHTTSVTLTATH